MKGILFYNFTKGMITPGAPIIIPHCLVQIFLHCFPKSLSLGTCLSRWKSCIFNLLLSLQGHKIPTIFSSCLCAGHNEIVVETNDTYFVPAVLQVTKMRPLLWTIHSIFLTNWKASGVKLVGMTPNSLLWLMKKQE